MMLPSCDDRHPSTDEVVTTTRLSSIELAGDDWRRDSLPSDISVSHDRRGAADGAISACALPHAEAHRVPGMSSPPADDPATRTPSARDDALRRDVRLVGDALGRVLVEQVGEELLADVERVRQPRAQGARTRARRPIAPRSRPACAHSTTERSTAVLRAFGLYFQLANVAEAWHRVRSRRRYEREERSRASRSPRPSAGSPRAASSRRAGPAGARGVSLELVITAHPTEAARRTVLQAQLQLSRILEALDDPALAPRRAAAARGRGRRRDHRALAGRRGALAAAARRSTRSATRCGSSRRRCSTSRPSVLAAYRERLPGRAGAVPLRLWVGGDQDGNPEAGPHTDPGVARARAPAGARPLPRRGARARAGDRRLDAHGARERRARCARSRATRASSRRSRAEIGDQNFDEPYRRKLSFVGQRLENLLDAPASPPTTTRTGCSPISS